MKTKHKSIIIRWDTLSIIILSVITLVCILEINSLKNELKTTEEFYKYYKRGITEYTYGIYNNYNGDYNYDLASWYYENNYLVDSIDYCKGARNLYRTSNENYHKAISYFKKANNTIPKSKTKYKELVNKYIEVSNLAIDINNALYETCEYLESACNYYLIAMLRDTTT